MQPHVFSDGTKSATKSVVRIHPLRFAIENCGGEMTALILAYGEPDLYLKRFPSNDMCPIATACDWASQNLAALGSLSALLEWAWKDVDPDEGQFDEREVIVTDAPDEGRVQARVANLQAHRQRLPMACGHPDRTKLVSPGYHERQL